jgi:Inner membrane protein YgaP-like, transmembrane domain
MTIDRWLRLIAGAFVTASVALGYWVSAYFFLFTAFVGVNLFQSGLTNWCPMMVFLRLLGVPAAASPDSINSIGSTSGRTNCL